MKQDIFNLFLIITICVVAYLIFRHFNINTREGLTSRSTTTTTTDSSSSSNGIAGGAAAYAANIKANSIKIHDQLLITKYRADYENVVLNLDDLVDNLMLEAALTVDATKPTESLAKIHALGQTKVALNSIMKFIDSTS